MAEVQVAGQVVLANPVQMKRLGSGRHTDRVDAEMLAKMLMLGTLPTVWVPPQEVREMRALLSHREGLVKQRTRYQNQAKAVLRRNGYPLDKNVDVRTWLRTCAEDLQLGAADLAILMSTIRMLDAVDEEIRATEAEISQRALDKPQVQLLMSITGVGLVAASVIWARIGNPWRFHSAKAVSRYAGLDPSVHQSGEKNHRGRISKNGAADLRRVLVQAAYQVAIHDLGSLGAFFRRKQEHLGRKRAVIATARKLLIVAWKIMLTGEPYRSCKAMRYKEKFRALRRHAARRPHDLDAALEEVLCKTHSPSPESNCKPSKVHVA